MRATTPEDYKQFMSWWEKRDKPPIPPEFFSDTGFIVDGVAALFLYKTNSAIAYLECMISNPDASKEDKDKALSDLIDRGIEEANRLGYKLIFATSTNPKVIERAKAHGFIPEANHSLLAKIL